MTLAGERVARLPNLFPIIFAPLEEPSRIFNERSSCVDERLRPTVRAVGLGGTSCAPALAGAASAASRRPRASLIGLGSFR
jgi:hypothetical protein